MSRRQANKWAAQDQQQYYQQQPQYQQPQYQQPPQQYYQQPAAAPAAAQASTPAATPSSVQQLKKLADLKAQGVLTDAEFTAAKARILSA